jgi:hypothetical protein
MNEGWATKKSAKSISFRSLPVLGEARKERDLIAWVVNKEGELLQAPTRLPQHASREHNDRRASSAKSAFEPELCC